jgi:hypothetical protein
LGGQAPLTVIRLFSYGRCWNFLHASLLTVEV